MKKRLLITGGRGFIGRHSIGPALAAGYEVHATMSPSGAAPLLPAKVKWHKVDLLAPNSIENLLAEVTPSHVLHTAWETTHGSYWSSPANLEWLGLLTRFLPAFVANGGQRFVSVGSCAEYDWSTGNLKEGEALENPHTFYGRIKLAHHHVVHAAAQQLGFSGATGRVFFGYGPHENPARIIPYACQQLAKGEPALFSSGQFERDFMHVDDIGRGFVFLLGSNIEGACNVSSGHAVSLATIVEILGEISGQSHLIEMGARPDRPDDPPLLLGNNALLRGTGWTPAIALETGLTDTYAWWQRETP